jgi:hypothetical protein
MWEFSDDYRVVRQETYLGGHLGPDEGATAPRIALRTVAGHEWFTAHPKWWAEPASAQ